MDESKQTIKEIIYGVVITVGFVFLAGVFAALLSVVFGSSWWVILLLGAPIGLFLIGD